MRTVNDIGMTNPLAAMKTIISRDDSVSNGRFIVFFLFVRACAAIQAIYWERSFTMAIECAGMTIRSSVIFNIFLFGTTRFSLPMSLKSTTKEKEQCGRCFWCDSC